MRRYATMFIVGIAAQIVVTMPVSLTISEATICIFVKRQDSTQTRKI